MFKTYSLLFFVSIFSHLALGQSSKSDTIYFDKSWYKTDKEHASYYRVMDSLEKEKLWHYKDYYFDSKKIQNDGYFYELNPNKKTGLHSWYYESGALEIQGKYEENRRIGAWKYFHENGKAKKEGSYAEGYRSGEWKWYYEDGSVESSANYEEGDIVGERSWYYPSGKLKRSGSFVDGKKSDQWTEYYEGGDKELVEEYEQGILKGTRTSWYENGDTKFEEEYVSGILQKDSKYFDRDGESVKSLELLERLLSYNLLWEITGNGLEKPSYLFGTMHVKDPRAFKFSDSLLTVFNSCEAFTMEIHPDSVFDFAYSEPEHAVLRHDYIAKTQRAKSNYSDSWNPWRKSNVFGARKSWERNRWVMNINQLFHRDGKVYQGMPYFLDAYLYTMARSQGKVCVGQEDILEHIEAGKDLPEYNKKYDILSKFDPQEEMISVYEQGNIERIRTFSNFLSGEEFNYRMLVDRNYKMAETIDSVVKNYSTFNTMGSAHLPGEEGVIEILRKKGYKLRPVKASDISEDEITKGDNYQFDWEVLKDTRYGFQIEFPRQPILFEKKYEITHMAPDLVNKTSYIAYGLDLSFEESFNGKLTEDFIGKYFDRKLRKIGFESITHNKLKGFEVQYFKKNYRGGKVYYRYRIFSDGYSLYFLGIGSLEENAVTSDASERFLSSFKLQDFESNEKTLTYSHINDSIAAFEFEIPSNYQLEDMTMNKSRRMEDDEEKNLRIYHSYDSLTGNTFATRCLRFEENSADDYFADIEEIYNSYFGPYQDVNLYSKGEVEYAEYEYSVNGNTVFVKAIFRKKRGYLAIAQIKNGDKARGKKFVDGFDVVPQNVSPLSLTQFPIEGISVYIPSKDSVDDREYDDDLGMNYWQSNKESYMERHYRKRGKLLNNYYFVDSLNGMEYNLRCWHLSEYAYSDDVAGYVNQLVSESYPSDDYMQTDSTVEDINGIKQYTYGYEGLESGLLYARTYFVVDTMLYSLRLEYTKELEEKIDLDKFLKGYKVTGNIESDYFSQNKFELLVDSLVSEDGIERAKAKGSLSYYELNDDNVDIIAEKFNNFPSDLDSNLVSKLESSFIDIMAESNNKKAVDYLLKWSQNHDDLSSYRELYILSSIAKYNLDTALTLFIDRLPKYDSLDNFDSYAAEKIFFNYSDSLELLGQDIDRLTHLIQYDFTRRYFFGLVEEVMDKEEQGEADASFLKDIQPKLIMVLDEQLQKMDSLRKDSSWMPKSEFIKLLKGNDFDSDWYDYEYEAVSWEVEYAAEEAYESENSYFDNWVHYDVNDTLEFNDTTYYMAVSNEYFNTVYLTQRLCELIRETGGSVTEGQLTALQKSSEFGLKTEAMEQMIQSGTQVPDSLWNLVLYSESGYNYVKRLVDQDKTDLLPAQYRSQEKITELQAKTYIFDSYSFEIKSLQSLGSRKAEIGDEKGLVYLYKVVYKDKKGTFIWAGGLQPKKTSEVNYDLNYVTVTRQYPGQSLEEVYEEILEEFKESANENWESEFGVE